LQKIKTEIETAKNGLNCTHSKLAYIILFFKRYFTLIRLLYRRSHCSVSADKPTRQLNAFTCVNMCEWPPYVMRYVKMKYCLDLSSERVRDSRRVTVCWSTLFTIWRRSNARLHSHS